VPDRDKRAISRRARVAKEDLSMLTASQRVTALAFILAASAATSGLAQETDADPDAPETMGSETMPEESPGSALQQAQEALTDQADMADDPMDQGMTSPGMMGEGMMCSEMCSGMSGQGRMGGMMQPGMMDSIMRAEMHGHAMRIGFALADANGDGGLSLDEIADMQARIFRAVDANDDGNLTPEELQAFIQG
jgi:hypothetical protein